jgi:protein-S-isoprenylcysteine O-methyltransferase Ste14
MKPGTIFKVVYFTGMVAQTVIRMPYDRQCRQQHVVVDQVDQQEQAALGLLFLGIGGIPLVYALTPWLKRGDYRWTDKTRVWAGGAGTLLLAASLWVFYRSHADLGHNWSPSLQVQEDHTLVTAGIYRHIRHPMYASEVLWSLAQPLLLQNWIAGWAGLAGFVPFYLLRVPQEEQMMREQFGAAYDDYVEQTGAIVPRPGTMRRK